MNFRFRALHTSVLRLFPCLHRLAGQVGKALYPPFCTVCSAGTAPGGHLCGPCGESAQRLKWEPSLGCAQCSRAFAGAAALGGTGGRCADCIARTPGFACAVAPYRASGVVREVIHGFKYEAKRHLVGVLAPWLAEGLEDLRLRNPAPQVLVPVPLHWWKLRRRGFNQAELLAQRLASGRGQPKNQGAGRLRQHTGELRVELLLVRRRDTGTQTVLDRAARLQNLREAFALRAGVEVRGRHLLLVDDVLTTGATLDACAQVLQAEGAASVRALAVARG